MLPHPRNTHKRSSYGLSIGGSREFEKTCYVDTGVWCMSVGIRVVWELIVGTHSRPTELESGAVPRNLWLTSFPSDLYASYSLN